jgi:hypothetical protein
MSMAWPARARAVFSFDVQTDQPPTVAISKPREDETVLPTAVVDVTGEAKDDVSVASLALERTVARGKAESMGAPPEAEGPAEVFAQWVSTTDGAASEPSGSEVVRAGATVESPLDLAPMNLQPGDEVWVVALANDLFEQQGRGTGSDPLAASEVADHHPAGAGGPDALGPGHGEGVGDSAR